MAEEGDLIPSLPEDLALECLIRVPYKRLPTHRSVCRLWKQTIQSSSFHRLRRSRGLTRTLVILAQSVPVPFVTHNRRFQAAALYEPFYRFTLYDTATGSWSALPPIPGIAHGLPLFCWIAAGGHQLVVLGGIDQDTLVVSNAVYIYNFESGAWRQGARIPGPLLYRFACEATDDDEAVVLMADGWGVEEKAFQSALAYDLARDEWSPLPDDMVSDRDGFKTLEFVQGGSPAKYAVAGGRFYTCAGGYLVVAEGTRWRSAVKLPADVGAARTPVLVGWDGGLMVTEQENRGGFRSAYILELEGLTWTKVPPNYSGSVHAACCRPMINNLKESYLKH